MVVLHDLPENPAQLSVKGRVRVVISSATVRKLSMSGTDALKRGTPSVPQLQVTLGPAKPTAQLTLQL